MPTLDQHPSNEFVKIIYIGDSGTGKTGSLVSLLSAGYKFKIIDLDNGLDSLKFFAQRDCPENLSNIEYETYRDEYRGTSTGPMLKGGAKAFNSAMKKMTEWSEISDPNTIFVLDSLSALGRAAHEWSKAMNPTAKDGRQAYFQAQQAVETVLAMVTGAEFRMNVIIISHVQYKEISEGFNKGFVNAVGSALGPHIPKYFNSLILAESSGSGKNVRRKIKTVPNGTIDLKTPNPTIETELPLETGLATIFSTLKG